MIEFKTIKTIPLPERIMRLLKIKDDFIKLMPEQAWSLNAACLNDIRRITKQHQATPRTSKMKTVFIHKNIDIHRIDTTDSVDKGDIVIIEKKRYVVHSKEHDFDLQALFVYIKPYKHT